MLLDKWFISRTFQNIKVNFISHQKTAQKENMQLHDRLKSTHIAKATCMQKLAIMPRSGNGICLIVCSFTINPRLPWSQVFFQMEISFHLLQFILKWHINYSI